MRSLGEAAGTIQVVALVIGIILAFIASNFLGIPAIEHENPKEKQNKGKKAKGFAAMVFVALCSKCADFMDKRAKVYHQKRLQKKKERRAIRLAREFGLADADGDGQISPEVFIAISLQSLSEINIH